MRRRPEISGYVITELTDCHWESNGLLDMRRHPRVFHDVFRTINADTVIVPEWARLAFWDDETFSVAVTIPNGPAAVENATLHVTLEASQSTHACTLQSGTVTDLGTMTVPLPTEDASQSATVLFEMRGPEGRLIASNGVDIAVHPSRLRRASTARAVWSPSELIRERLQMQGYFVADAVNQAEIVIAAAYDEAIAAYVRGGGRCCCSLSARCRSIRSSRIGRMSRSRTEPERLGAATGHRHSLGCVDAAHSPACPADRCSMRRSIASFRIASSARVTCSTSRRGFTARLSSAGFTSLPPSPWSVLTAGDGC